MYPLRPAFATQKTFSLWLLRLFVFCEFHDVGSRPLGGRALVQGGNARIEAQSVCKYFLPALREYDRNGIEICHLCLLYVHNCAQLGNALG